MTEHQEDIYQMMYHVYKASESAPIGMQTLFQNQINVFTAFLDEMHNQLEKLSEQIRENEE